MTAICFLLCVLVTAATVAEAIKPPPDNDWRSIKIPPAFTFPIRPAINTTHPTRCSEILTHSQCVITRPCPEGPPIGSYCRWGRFRFPIRRIGKRSTEEHHDSEEKENQKRQVAGPFPLPRPRPRPLPHGFCTCCVITACDPPMRFNRATCRCECPRGTRKNARGQCVGNCDNIRNLNLCPKIYCADNPHFRCKRVGYQCKCPSCDAASERAWCVRTKCLEQPQKLKCMFDSNTYKCRCPRCMDQNGDRPWCLMTYCGPNNSVRCKWEAAWRECFCPAH